MEIVDKKLKDLEREVRRLNYKLMKTPSEYSWQSLIRAEAELAAYKANSA